MAEGGYIPGSPVAAPLHRDECLIALDGIGRVGLLCSRAEHPTQTSDCTRPGTGISHG